VPVNGALYSFPGRLPDFLRGEKRPGRGILKRRAK